MPNERDSATMERARNVQPDTVSFTERLLASDSFMLLFREGMALVEATAAYLDGEGRADSRVLERPVALAYASESMRLTTRLMQLTSWLLLQRAVNEGEITREEAEREHRRVVIAPAPGHAERMGTEARVFDALPETLKSLVERSTSLHARIQRLDQDLKSEPEPAARENPVADQLGRLAAAFQRR